MQIDIETIFKTLAKRRMWIIVPAVAFAGLAVIYGIFKQDHWLARQALFIRDESIGQLTPLGRFDSVDAMQTAQETIYEVSQHRNVLRQAMIDVGPESRFWSKRKRAEWPAPKVVDDFRKDVSVEAPNGAQFGRTELIYLTVKSTSPQRAVALTDAMTLRLVQRMKDLRRQKYKAIVAELTRSSAIARTELDKAVIQLEALDRRMGSDVVELRVMNKESLGEGTLRRSLGEIRTELRQAHSAHARKKMQRDLLHALRNDAHKLTTISSELLDAQPALSGLKKGLVDAQMLTARLSGEMSADHPRVRAAMLAETKLRQRLYNELRTAIKHIDVELNLSQARLISLEKQHKGYERKFAQLSDVRATYSRLTKEVEQRQRFIDTVETDLAIARAHMAAATAASTIQRIDQPMSDIEPIGPSGISIGLAGLFGGLFTGLGLVWLLEPVQPTRHRRLSDSINLQPANKVVATGATQFGGRRNDNRFGRRVNDWTQAVWPDQPPSGDGAETASPG
jgi:succinoglycan biosynthesis transport protein ExoP